MIFASKNEEGITKADWMAQLPIGAKVVTRREIENSDFCLNNRDYFSSGIEDTFFPAKYPIGKELFIAKRPLDEGEEEGDNALCVCGKEKKLHFDIQLFCPRAMCTKSDKDITIFKPVLYKITGGMWHKKWWNVRKNSCYSMFEEGKFEQEEFQPFLEKEARLEGFNSWNGLAKAFRENEDKWGKLEKSWRIEMERIQ